MHSSNSFSGKLLLLDLLLQKVEFQSIVQHERDADGNRA
jgi:hypothetical protein